MMMSDETTVQKCQEASQNIPSLEHIIFYSDQIKQLYQMYTSRMNYSSVSIILTSGSTIEPGRVILTNLLVSIRIMRCTMLVQVFAWF